MENNRKTALVLGANGFVGYGVATALSREGYKVYGVIRQEKYAHYLALQEVLPVVGNFENTEWIDDLSPIDVIINTVEVYENQDKFSDDLFNLITKIARKQSTKPLFIYTSGIKIYGDTGRLNEPGFHSVDEDTPYNPLSLIAFRIPLVERFEASPDLYTVTVIPGMIYGKGQSYYGPWIKQAATSDKIIVRGSPDTVWHGVHIDDVADVYVRLANLGEKAHQKRYNVTNEKYERFEDIMLAISQQFGGNHQIVYVKPGDSGTPDEFAKVEAVSAWVKSEKVRKDLGWLPKKVNFIEGIEENVASWKASEKDAYVQTVQPIKYP